MKMKVKILFKKEGSMIGFVGKKIVLKKKPLDGVPIRSFRRDI